MVVFSQLLVKICTEESEPDVSMNNHHVALKILIQIKLTNSFHIKI